MGEIVIMAVFFGVMIILGGIQTLLNKHYDLELEREMNHIRFMEEFFGEE